ncbi:MAG: chlororespiratory reduction protein 7 [Cyanobacteria bacterium J06648_11]
MSELFFDPNHYVLLMPGAPEEFLTRSELVAFLQALMAEYPQAVDADLKRFDDLDDRAQRLIETACELDFAPGQTVQWYAVRLSK